MKNYIDGLKFGISAGIMFFIFASLAFILRADFSGLEAGDNNSVLTQDKWNEMIKGLAPTNAILAFNQSTCPSGWLPADGTNGTPDLRGMFLRGINTFDGGSTTRSDGNQDPDSGSLGVYQADQFKSHNHGYGGTTHFRVGGGNTKWMSFGNNSYAVARSTTQNRGGTETRGKNIGVIYCIRQ